MYQEDHGILEKNTGKLFVVRNLYLNLRSILEKTSYLDIMLKLIEIEKELFRKYLRMQKRKLG